MQNSLKFLRSLWWAQLVQSLFGRLNGLKPENFGSYKSKSVGRINILDSYEDYTPGTRCGPGGSDRTLAVKSRQKNIENQLKFKPGMSSILPYL